MTLRLNEGLRDARPGLGFLMADLMRLGARFAPDDGEGGGSFEEEDDLSDADLDDGTADTPANDAERDSETEEEDPFLASLKEADEKTKADKPAKPDAKPTEAAEPDAEDLADDRLIAVKVGEQVHKVAAKDLKALFEQREGLTAQSRAVTEANTLAAQRTEHAQKVVKAALEKAEARFKPYAELDFLVLSKRLDEQTLKDLRDEARAAHAEVETLRQMAGQTEAAVTETRQVVDREKAQSAVRTLQADFPKEFGEEWSDKVYGEVMEFAEAQGLKGAKSLVDPAAIKLIRMAQLFQRGKTVAEKALKPATNQPRKPLRAGAADSQVAKAVGLDKTLARLRRTGSADDAEAAFLASLKSGDE
jgi:hypothetical protein